jgi:hypothetical protein
MTPARLTLVLLALAAPWSLACSGSTKPATSQAPLIVGTWSFESGVDIGKSAAKMLRKEKPEATDAEVEALTKDAVAAAGPRPRFTFNADGTGLLEGMVFDHPIADPVSWELIEASASRISINTWTPTQPKKDPMVFSVESPDLLVLAEGFMRGTRLVRVK